MAFLWNSLSKILCYTSLINFGEDIVVVNTRPVGNCWICCPLNEQKDITYTLHTRRTTPQGRALSQHDPALTALAAGANPYAPTIVFMHGFTNTATGRASQEIKNAYLSIGDFNVILVDWGKMTAFPWYGTAVDNCRRMGNNLSRFLQRLDQGGIPLSTIHVIGFSLGAEAAGFAGKTMPRNKRIPRITGLDPAFPLFFSNGDTTSILTAKLGRHIGLDTSERIRRIHTHHYDVRLSVGDADFIDVIHTDAGILGYPTPMGDVDFYPNGGLPLQPGCKATDVATMYGYDITKYISCSHSRAWMYYAESIRNPAGFPATRCPRWEGVLPPCQFQLENYMGIAATNSTKGKLYLKTNPAPPFSIIQPSDIARNTV